jgi:hypothetical protein
MRLNISLYIVSLIMILSMASIASAEKTPIIVNLMIDTDFQGAPTEEQVQKANSDLVAIFNEINGRNSNATIYVTEAAAASAVSLQITQLGLHSDFEIAMAGNHTNKILSLMPLARQMETLTRTKKIVETCHICGEEANTVVVKGFLPYSFDQNEGTYISLDNLGFEYDAGFQSGLLYAPGHENDVWPYQYPDHNFYAVPISTYDLSGEKIFLQDSYLMSKGLSGSQWLDLLKGKFDDAASKGEPMVVLLSTSTSGEGDYLDALSKFLDYALSNDARFVTTMDLVNMTRTGVYTAPASVSMPQDGNAAQDENTAQDGDTAQKADSSSECKTCSQKAMIGFGPIENVSANITLTAPVLEL